MSVQPVTSDQATWYTPAPGQEKRDVATEAYHKAVELLKAELGINPNTPVPEENIASITDMHILIGQAKQTYEDASKKHMGARKWLEKLSARILHYGRILDTLAQHHPEYVALAWGTMKIVLMGVLNRATLVEELAKALVSIADKLPRAHLNVDMYKTSDMAAALSRLYTCILMFFRLCARWYKRSSWGRLWSSLKDPFELKYKDLLADIELCSNLVENLASAGARVEIRNVHALTESDHAKLIEIDAKTADAFDTQMRKLEEIDKSVSKVCSGQSILIDGQKQLLSSQGKIDQIDIKVVELFKSQSTLIDGQSQLFNGQARLEARLTQVCQIVTLSQSTLDSTHSAVYRLELQNIFEFFKPKILPGVALSKVQPSSQRRPTMNDARLERMLRDWASNRHASLLLLQAGTRAQTQTTELAADVVNHLRGSGEYVFWNISSGRSAARKMTIQDVFKSIIFQALQQAGATFADMAEQLHPQKIHGTHTDREWVDLICLLFARLPRAFLVIETEDMRDLYCRDQAWVNQFSGLIKLIVDRAAAAGCQLKVLLFLHDSKKRALVSRNLRIATLSPPSLIPPRLRHLVGQPGLNLKGWKLGGKKP
ncbi:hypothetical protein EKO04_008923 [Ascochyta lentis]|uniref:DUF7708 domain-containing protein n=1 Tax=Ascochyta lentis TaxID=205686 RepID=A0A8H7IUP2_9PLEO|nr:hypothetical protein EKO04_008923 [Ascochyta lentis]